MNVSVASGFARHHESVVVLDALPDVAFAYLDDFTKLSAHMQKRSTMMMGSRVTIETDALGGRTRGSRVRMSGRVLGMELSLEEVVTEREPPFRKAWQTVDARLIVIGQYRLGFALSPRGGRSELRVFIDYDLPHKGVGLWLGKLFGRTYARWCTEQMANDALARFRRDLTGERIE